MTYPGSQPVFSAAPIRLAEDTATTGVMPFAQPFPLWLALPKGGEQALAINVAGQGIVLITGCGHMGVEALLDRAGGLFQAPVIGVIGGLHYGNASLEKLQPQLDLLQAIQPGVIAVSPHDSGPQVLDTFAQAFPAAYQTIQVGQTIQFP
jgi:7,8-dihydropterin-6-yl-methyl-4-(beta-D-ribofuranosyl)aminobenzene 5'-phosphate synthase